METPAPKAIIIGASSGIGRALSKVIAQQGYEVGLTARRIDLLRQLQNEIPTKSFLRQMDLRQTEEAMTVLRDLIREMGGLDLIVLNAGVNHPNLNLEWSLEEETLRVNGTGFMAMANVAAKYFLGQGRGHIAGISSVAGIRGSGRSPAYSASKALISNYLDGLRQRFRGLNIFVSDIRPGFVDTPMIRGRPKSMGWVSSCEKAAQQIYGAIEKKKEVAYITRRWKFLAFIYRHLPKRFVDWGYWKVIRNDQKCAAGENKILR